MNLVDCVILQIKDISVINDKYCILVKYIAEGVEEETYLSFDTIEEASKISVGYKFLG